MMDTEKISLDDEDIKTESGGDTSTATDNEEDVSPRYEKEELGNESAEKEESYKDKYLEIERKYNELLDIKNIMKEFPSLSLDSVDSMEDSEGYRRLRAMGVDVKGAFLATNYKMLSDEPSKSHITTVISGEKSSPYTMKKDEYTLIRAIFGDELSDEKINELYRRVKNNT